MKKIIATLFVAMIGITAMAQEQAPTKKEHKKKAARVRPTPCPAFYITASTGINNNTGIIGFSFDVPVTKNISIDGGPGAGTWNYKIYTGVKYYLKPCHRGFAFGAGITYCTGLRDDQRDLTTVYGNTETIEYNKNPQTNILFSAYKYWNLGKRNNRWYLQAGWTVPIGAGPVVTQLTGNTMSSNTIDNLSFYAPGGLILAIGVSFGVH